MSSTTNTVATTQDDVPEIIAKLRTATLEVLQNSNGPPLTFHRDPHLRLRRTLTPRSAIPGIRKYSEAQFVIHPTTGQRRTLHFHALENNHEFLIDAYSWGASEQDATIRIVALHGISPTASRERWHALGHRIQQDPVLSQNVRLVALDWHSLDRGDAYQEEFLTLLPKHIFTVPSDDAVVEEISQMFSNPQHQVGFHKLINEIREFCPRPMSEGADILQAIITQGLGWGDHNKPFILCIKSWSGGVGMEFLNRADPSLRQAIAGLVISHPACFNLTPDQIKEAMKDTPTIMVWAKDDDLVPYPLSERYLVHDNVQLVTYETGGHGSFDGSNPNDPNFDDDILVWIRQQFVESTSNTN
jgi:hypothetical protein